ncbi:hypothetical protein HOY82DRAFT_568438, partial [Tuber indicum]
MNADMFLVTALLRLYLEYLSSSTEPRKQLVGDWVLGGDGEKLGVKNVLDTGGGCAGVPAWRSVIEAEEGVKKDEFSEKTGKLPSGLNGKVLLAAGERSGFWAVVRPGLFLL